MQRISKYTFTLLFLVFGAAITSCTKPGVDPVTPTGNLKDPSLVLTPSAVIDMAGIQVTIDFTTTAPRGIKHIKIEEQFDKLPKRILKDSDCPKKPVFNDENYHYTIPDSAATGQISLITFTITDSSGASVTKQTKITVSGSRPRISVTQGATTANSGDSVMFAINVKSVENNLDSLVISQSVNTAPTSVVRAYNYADVANINKTYYYKVPAGLKSGDQVVLFFKAKNNTTVSTSVNKKIMIN